MATLSQDGTGRASTVHLGRVVGLYPTLPPVMSRVWPVTQPAASEARYAAAAATSAGSPIRPNGNDLPRAAIRSGGRARSSFALRTADGARQLNRTPVPAYSSARCRVSITTPAL